VTSIAERGNILRHGRTVVIALLGGLAWGWSQGIVARPLVAVAALSALFLALEAKRPFLVGWLWGTASWLTAVPWIVPTLTIYGFIAGWLAGVALLLMAAYLGLYFALFAGFAGRLWRRGDALSLVALPALWVAVELLRGWLLSGFPWNLAAYAWIDLPGALPMASWIGAFGVSGLVASSALLLARAVRGRRWDLALVGLLAPALLLAFAERFALTADPRGETRSVRVLQPNIPNRPFFDAVANVADYQRLLAQSRVACTPGALLLWPESAIWPRDWQDDVQLREDVRDLVEGGGCAILFNTAFMEGKKTFNSVLIVSAATASRGGELKLQRADKRHLVPFGEYVPLRTLFPFVGKIARMVGDFSPAERISLLDWNGERLGAAVCYEVIFPGETAALVRAGATLLVTVTNDAWYGDTAAPRQHLRAARFRAAENRRWLLRAAVTGISAVVRPDGSLASSAEVGEVATLAAEVNGRRDLSPYSRSPWLLPALATLLAAAGWLRARSGGA
jgi:apolipoprotein N-acyltransferase